MVYSDVNGLTGLAMLENQESIDKLFYELASESRLAILRELSDRSWKMNDIARKLDLTTTETFRQLTRLNEALLTQKQPNGTYVITPYGRLVLQLFAPLEFVFKYKQYFMAHDVQRLPASLVNRLGELSKANLRMGMIESTTRISQMIGEAKKYLWAVAPEPPLQPLDWIATQVPKGAEFRLLSTLPSIRIDSLENRSLSETPVIAAITEKEAVVCFSFLEGRVDYAGFFGTDPIFHNWVKDLFSYYWDKAKRA